MSEQNLYLLKEFGLKSFVDQGGRYTGGSFLGGTAHVYVSAEITPDEGDFEYPSSEYKNFRITVTTDNSSGSDEDTLSFQANNFLEYANIVIEFLARRHVLKSSTFSISLLVNWISKFEWRDDAWTMLLATIQDKLGQDDGGYASMILDEDEWAEANRYGRGEIIKSYILSELNMLTQEDE